MEANCSTADEGSVLVMGEYYKKKGACPKTNPSKVTSPVPLLHSSQAAEEPDGANEGSAKEEADMGAAPVFCQFF